MATNHADIRAAIAQYEHDVDREWLARAEVSDEDDVPWGTSDDEQPVDLDAIEIVDLGHVVLVALGLLGGIGFYWLVS